MIKSEKKVQELSSLLAKENIAHISKAIGLLRDDEPFEGAIGLLASFYERTEDQSVKKYIEQFMNDLKDQSVAGEIIAEIRKPYSQATISMLVSSCWQSGLNYSKYSDDLVDVFLKSDYGTALECLTVIEESAHKLSRTKKNDLIRIINEYSFSPGNEKALLLRELLLILKRD
jgi:hypothetical protein